MESGLKSVVLAIKPHPYLFTSAFHYCGYVQSEFQAQEGIHTETQSEKARLILTMWFELGFSFVMVNNIANSTQSRLT